MGEIRGTIAGALCALVLLPVSPLAAQGAQASSSIELARAADRLKPGEWVWAADAVPAGPLLIYVDLSRQLATVYRNGVRIGVSTVSTGKQGHETPTGIFTILQKDPDHKSSLYHSAPMPFQQRLTWDGVALHAGGLPGYPESHGCVHLPYGFSQQLFGITKIGMTVVIEGDAVNHVRTSDNSLLVPIDGKGKAIQPVSLGAKEFVWTPERSSSGPLTIIVSKSDQEVVVLRNGIEIGRSHAEINDDDPGAHVISLTTGPDGKPRWIYLGLPGHDENPGDPVDEAVLNRLRLPHNFYEAVHKIVVPGTTVIITRSRVDEGETGHPLTILDSVSPVLSSQQ